MHEHYDERGARLAALEAEMQNVREEVRLSRARYHDLSNQMAPLLFDADDLQRHETELRSLRRALDRVHGMWIAISVAAAVLTSLVAAGWAMADHFHLF